MDEDDKAAAAGTLICILQRACDDAGAAGAGGSPDALAVTPAPPSVDAINAFSIPSLDISQDETGANRHAMLIEPKCGCNFICRPGAAASVGVGAAQRGAGIKRGEEQAEPSGAAEN
jgi:hypothetical protein